MSSRRASALLRPGRRVVRRLPLAVTGVTCLVAGLVGASVLPSPALAIPTCPAGSPNTTTVTPGDGSTAYTVPSSGVSALQVVAQGGQGAATSGTFNGIGGVAGGHGAVVTTDLSVSSSETLTVAAGSAASGGSPGETGNAAGGAEGGSGGPAGTVASGTVQTGGGGAGSTVYDGGTLLVVAGGGGGGGYGAGTGGNAATNSGGHSAGAVTSGGNGTDSGDGIDGGGSGGSSTPGGGGAGGGATGSVAGSPGSGMEGGAGGVGGYGGAGGGGGGYAGGGGGGSGSYAAGGGAGSSYSTAAYTLGGGSGDGSVTLSWEDPSITSSNHATFDVGTAGSFRVCTTGVPTDTISAGSGFPSWATFTDNHDGTATIAGTPPNTAGGNYTFTITAANGNGTDATQSFTLSVPPAVTAVSSTAANGSAFKAGGSVAVTVTFSEPVTVTGTPRLALDSGGTASFTSGSGTSTLTFTYTVASGQNANPLDYTSTGALSLNGGTIQDSAGNAAVLTLPTTGSGDGLYDKGIVIDTTNPLITLTTPANNAVYTQGSTVHASYSCNDGSGSGIASCVGTVASGSPISTTNGPHTFTVTAADKAGNGASTTVHYVVGAQLSPGQTSCNGYYAGTGQSVVVPRGANCTLLSGTHVLTDVKVQKGGTLTMNGVTVGHDLSVDGSAMICGSSIGHDLTADGSVTVGGPTCAGNTIGVDFTVQNVKGGATIEDNTVGHNLNVLNDQGAVDVADNSVGQDMTVQHDGSPTTVSDNTIGHNATCHNNLGQTGSGNTAGGSDTCPA